MFFPALHDLVGGGFPRDTVDALWRLVWHGLVTNDSLHALRAFVQPPGRSRRPGPAGVGFRSRRDAPPAAQGRWALVRPPGTSGPSPTQWSAAVAQQLLTRYGIVTREVTAAEAIPGGFSGVYDVYRSMEERGRLRRGYFTTGVGAVQFALPVALELLRTLRLDPDLPEVVRMAASDTANPYGAVLRWPAPDTPLAGTGRGPTRSVGAWVVMVDGRLAAYVGRGGRPLLSFLPEDDPDRSACARGVAARLATAASADDGHVHGLIIPEVNGAPAAAHPLSRFLVEAGFVASALGFHVPRRHLPLPEDAALTGRVARASRSLRPSLVSSPFAALRQAARQSKRPGGDVGKD